MKKGPLILLLVSISFVFSGCDILGIRGSGNIVENSYSLTDFTSIRASNTCDLTTMKGDEYSVIVSCDDNILPYLEVYVTDNMLTLDLESGYFFSHIEFNVTVIMPELNSLKVSGASAAVVSGFQNSSSFYTDVSGASDVRIDFISSAHIDCQVSGASELTISSITSTGQMIIDCSGASELDCKNTASTDGDIAVSGASEVYVNLSGALTASVSGASALYYSGNPTLHNIDISGASRLERF
ncbi:MAG: DUF2807 domain-containing protein [Spirochaetaceae bacterium]|nr:DUF2807 domain-containing protein [Spirochaetaceae bacterium]